MRKNTGLYLDQDLISRARAAIQTLAGTQHDLGSLSTVVERLLEAEVAQLENTHNNGTPFPEASSLPRGKRQWVPVRFLVDGHEVGRGQAPPGQPKQFNGCRFVPTGGGHSLGSQPMTFTYVLDAGETWQE